MADSYPVVVSNVLQTNEPFTKLDKKLMRRALVLAKRGWGHVSPNPMVGCVIADGVNIIAEGYHRRFGGGHAETEALQRLNKQSPGATMYVTLEPCSHYGKTPPCVDAIIKSKIRRVVIGASDPNPTAAGGIKVLSKNGIICQKGLLAEESKNLNRAFFVQIEKRRPMITLKLASTLNGYIARKDGTSQWITSLEARKRVHYLRGGHQAILVGNETLLKDNPRLDCRFYKLPDPIRLCVDRHGRIPSQLNIFGEGIVIYFSRYLRDDLPGHVHQVVLKNVESYDAIFSDVLDVLYKRGIHSLFVEGGSHLARFLIGRNLVDYAYLFIGGQYFCAGGTNVFGGSFEPGFQMEKVSKLGNSILVEGTFSCSQES